MYRWISSVDSIPYQKGKCGMCHAYVKACLDLENWGMTVDI